MSQDPTIGNDAKTGDGAPPDGLDDLAVTHDHLLGKTVSIMQPKSGFRVGTDAVLLAAAIGVNRGRILDMGAGVGGVSLCLARRLDAVQITAIEIDPVMAALAQRNVAANGFDDRLRILRDDIAKMPPFWRAVLIMLLVTRPIITQPAQGRATNGGLWRISAKVWRLVIGLNRQCGRQNRVDGSALFAGLIGRMN